MSVLQEQGQMRMVERRLIAVEAMVSRVSRSRELLRSRWCGEEEKWNGSMDVVVRCCSTFIAIVAQSERSGLML